MTENRSADAIVIGAGIAGATAAAHLAAGGRRVVILEAEESAGYHTTGRSAAIWVRNYGSPDARILSAASRPFFLAPPPGFADGAPLARPRAVVHLAPPDQVPRLQEMMREAPDMRPMPLEAVHAAVPPLRRGYAAAAAVEEDCFDMDVAALHAGFLRQATADGGRLALRHRAGRIWREGGRWRVEGSDPPARSSRPPCW